MAKASELDDVSLLKMFIALRDRRARRKADYNVDDAGDKDKQSNIEVEFLKRFNERGIDNVSSNGVGTAYRSTRVSATVGDWDALLEHIQKDDAWEMLERRVNKTAVLQYKEENADLPPGVNWSETQVINFRRK
jgi:predicted PolB exonuclease-like 3'-5' exonuclease